MTQDELNLVLDALKWCHGGEPCGTTQAIAVVEKALAQPEQEPAATVTSETGADITMSWWHEPALPVGTKLFTHPPQGTWVGLIDKDMNEPKTHILDFIAGARWAESILKGRNT